MTGPIIPQQWDNIANGTDQERVQWRTWSRRQGIHCFEPATRIIPTGTEQPVQRSAAANHRIRALEKTDTCHPSFCTYYSYMKTAKIFRTGGSQAVRLPKEFRFDNDEVHIQREGRAVILEPKAKRRWPRGFFQSIHIADSRFQRPPQGHLPPVRAL